MSKSPFRRVPESPEAPAPAATLTIEEAAHWRHVVQTRQDAIRAAELAAIRARLAVAEAGEAEILMVRGIAARYRFDPNLPWALTAADTVVLARQADDGGRNE